MTLNDLLSRDDVLGIKIKIGPDKYLRINSFNLPTPGVRIPFKAECTILSPDGREEVSYTFSQLSDIIENVSDSDVVQMSQEELMSLSGYDDLEESNKLNESKYLVYVHYYHEDDDRSENLISNQYVEADNPDDATKIAEDNVKEWCNSMRGIYEFTYSEPPILLTPEVAKSMNLNPSILDEADDGYESTPMEQFGTINDLIDKRIDDYYDGTYSDESLVNLIQSRLPLIEKIKQQADIETRSYINQVVAEWKDILADLEPVLNSEGPNMDDYDDLDDEPEIMPPDMDDEDYDNPDARPYF